MEIDAYLDQLRGPAREDAWHALVEIGPEAIPAAAAALATTDDPTIRVVLIKLLGEYRAPEAIPAITTQLQHPVPEVWQAAPDAMVKIGGEQALAALTYARSVAAADRHPWIDEAITQVRSGWRPAG
jgi:HEAT repeat protein